jgi:hypothetical protein
MKITIEDTTNRKVSLECLDEVDIFEAIDNICGLLVSYGFHPESVKDGIIAKAEEYEDSKEI